MTPRRARCRSRRATLLSAKLADLLGVEPGSSVTVEVLEGGARSRGSCP